MKKTKNYKLKTKREGSHLLSFNFYPLTPFRLAFFSFYLLTFNLKAQTPTPSSSENYIMTTDYLTKTANADSAIYNIMYFDGLGREKQSVLVRGTSDNKDIVTKYEYDGLGRQVTDYLPVPTTQANGVILNGIDIDDAYDAYYNAAPYNTTVYFSAKELENSPLNRVLKQGAPGDDWALNQGKEIKFQYYSNNATEVIIYRVDPSTGDLVKGLSGNKNYAAKSLYKSITTDENGNSIQEFKNKQGQVILKRSYVANGALARGTDPGTEPQDAVDTYYVYNAYGELAYVIPPNLSVLYAPGNTMPSGWGDMMNNLGYAYHYDAKGRMIDKKLPGKEWEYMEYDKQDRLVAVQDANMRTHNQWLFTKYDRFGRVVYTGMTNGSRSSVRTQISSAGSNNEQRDNTGFSKDGITVRYTNTAFPTTADELYTVNYYDYFGNIDMNGATAPSVTHRTGASDKDNSLKGLPVASSIRILNTGVNDWEHTYTYYDRKSRPLRTYKKNYLGGFTLLDTKLDFRGKTNETTTTHKRTTGGIQVKTLDKFTYNKQERLVSHTQKLNDAALLEQLIAYNEYDKLGQPITKKVGGTSPTGANRWQEINYRYNVRGWLTDINNIYDQLTGDPGIPSDDLFSFRIQYNDLLSGSTGYADPLYNGNIAQAFWKTSTDNIIRGYSYEYDQLNRLRSADFYKAGTATPYTGAYDEAMAYDLNGNILSLVRYTGDATNNQIDMDELTYTYDIANGESNRLMKVTDSMSSSLGFSNGSSGTSNDYTYDDNGNMISDLNKGITEIIYNHLNLPEFISFANGSAIEYLYNAVGVKVKKTVSDVPNNTLKNIDYLEGFQYAGEVLQFFPHAEGYVSATPTSSSVNGTINGYTYNYVYNYTDHLGNIRVSYSKDPVNNQLKIMEQNHYYPFGLKHGVYAGGKMQYKLVDEEQQLARPTFVNKTDYQYKYNGQEWQDELGLNMYDMDMRMYDPAIARWVVQDPVIHHSMSTYNAFDNNPVFWADPSGADSEFISAFADTNFQNYGTTDIGQIKQIQETKAIISDFGKAASTAQKSENSNNISQNSNNGDLNKNSNSIFKNSEDCPKCWWLNDDEYLTFEEAIWQYRLGEGQPVNVRLNKLDLSSVKSSDFDNPDFMHEGNPGKYVRLSSVSSMLTGNRSEGLVFGTIEAVYIGDNKIMVLPNEYNFEMQGEKSLRGVSRDLATAFGGFYNDGGMGGQSYWIQFLGTATIQP